MGAVEPFFPLLAVCARAQTHPAQATLLRKHAQALQQWDGLPDRAEAHGLVPLLYNHLQAAGIAIPPTIKQQLQGYYMQHAHATRVRTQVLSDILTCFQAAGIDVLVLKGAALAHLVYPQPVLRPMRDIDILVRAEEVYRAYALLPSIGFTPPQGATQTRRVFFVAFYDLDDQDLRVWGFWKYRSRILATTSFTSARFNVSKPVPLQPGRYYHIYNRGNNRENLFLEERNYRHFLKLYGRYVAPVANTYAYCLLKNHFHVLVRIKMVAEQGQTGKILNPSQQLGNLFNAYSKAINKAYRRSGSLFEHPFERIEVTSEQYLLRLIIYIHHNPQKHGLIADFRDWPYSSYQALCSTRPTGLRRDDVIAWFGGPAQLAAAHGYSGDDPQFAALRLEGFD
jgi:REP element-mobilizing transposase RayT